MGYTYSQQGENTLFSVRRTSTNQALIPLGGVTAQATPKPKTLLCLIGFRSFVFLGDLPRKLMRWQKRRSPGAGEPPGQLDLAGANEGRRRYERNLAESNLPKGKMLSNFNFERVPMISKARVMALASNDSWIEQGVNVLFFGRHGAGKSHLGRPHD